MTPFELDAVINPQLASKKQLESSSVSELRRKQEMMMGELYLDNEEESSDRIIGCRLYDKDFD
jgi:hypothetical protein